MEQTPYSMNMLSQEKADAIKKTPEVQNLLRMLQEQNGSLMEKVMESVRCKDYANVRQLLQPAMESKQIQEALQDIGKTLG